jgi:hypothetical protein
MEWEDKQELILKTLKARPKLIESKFMELV